MAVTVKRAVLWRRELENRPGTLAETLKPFADAKINLQVVMGYAYPGERDRSAVEVYPVSGAKSESAARQAGLSPADAVHCLIVEGDDRVGLAHQIAESLSGSGTNISFAVIQVVARRYHGVFGFESEAAALKATELIKASGRTAAKGHRASTARKAGARKSKGRSTAAGKGSAKRTSAKAASSKKASPSRTAAGKGSSARKPARASTAKKPTATKRTAAKKRRK